MLAEGRQLNAYFGGYAQDDWKVTNRLTLNLGIRYELYTQPIDSNNLGSLFDLVTHEFAVPDQGGLSRAIVQGDHNDWAPRIGFAYQLTPKLVVRGGYGLFYAMRDQNQSVTQFSGNTPNVPTVSLQPVSATETVTPPYTINTPITVLPATTTLNGFTPAMPYSVEIKTQSLNYALMPLLYQYNLDIQYQVTNSTLLETSYSGALGRDQASLFIDGNQVPFSAALAGQNHQVNRPYSNIDANVLGVYSDASSNYNALNVKVQQRMAHGVAFLANYSWQKNIESQGTGPDSYNQNGGTSIALDTYDLSKERGVAPINVGQTLTTSAIYELPWGRKALPLWRRSGPAASRWLGGERHPYLARRVSYRHSHQCSSAGFQYIQRSELRSRSASEAPKCGRQRLFQSGSLYRARDYTQRDRCADSGVWRLRPSYRRRTGIDKSGFFDFQEFLFH